MTHIEFMSITFSEILSYFSNKINQLKIINFKRVGLTFIKNVQSYLISKNGTKYRQILIIGRAMNGINAWSCVVF